MARPLRLNLAGAFYHVIHRGNYRQKIFLDDTDRKQMLARLRRLARLFRIQVHAYCLLDNHIHLILETRRANLSAFGQRFFGSYTQWFNRRRRRVGHLFQGRFKAILVEKEGYLAELSRYIHLNPVRAGMVQKPEEHPWSSMGRYAAKGRGEKWIWIAEILKGFDGSRKAYMEYVYRGIGETWKPTILDGLFLGAASFADRVKGRLGWLDGATSRVAVRRDADGVKTARVIREVAARFGVPRESLSRRYQRTKAVGNARRVASALMRRVTLMSYRQIGERLGGVEAPVAAWAAREGETRPDLKRIADDIESKIHL